MANRGIARARFDFVFFCLQVIPAVLKYLLVTSPENPEGTKLVEKVLSRRAHRDVLAG